MDFFSTCSAYEFPVDDSNVLDWKLAFLFGSLESQPKVKFFPWLLNIRDNEQRVMSNLSTSPLTYSRVLRSIFFLGP